MEEWLKIQNLFALSHSIAGKRLAEKEYPWQILPEIGAILAELGETLPPDRYDHPSDGVWIAKNATVDDKATVLSPCIIGERTEIRPGAYLRGNVIVGDDCVIGNSTELKNCILFDRVQVPHYNYVGDSILGYGAHMGAGAVTSNVKGDKSEVHIHTGTESIPTGLKKCGAFLGDGAEIGCHTVLNPGCVIGCYTNVYPLCSVRGTVAPQSILKDSGEIAAQKTE